MQATLSATPSFEYSVAGTPYRFVIMPRLAAPAKIAGVRVVRRDSPGAIAKIVPDSTSITAVSVVPDNAPITEVRVVPDGAPVAKVEVHKNTRVRTASVTVTAGKAVAEGGTIVHEGTAVRIEGGKTIYTISPRVTTSGDADALMVKVDGQAKPAGFDLNTVPPGSIVRIEMANRGTVEAKAMGGSDGQTVVNIVTKP